MKRLLTLAFLLAALGGELLADATWALDAATDSAFIVRGKASEVAGVQGRALALDGASLIEIGDSATLTQGEEGFTFAVWVNPFEIGNEQQVIAAKNRYSSKERQWSLTIEKDGRFRLFVDQGGWRTVSSQAPAQAGHWHQVGVVVRRDGAELWVNGSAAGRIALDKPAPRTGAPVTLGGVNDNGNLRQLLFGALDDARLHDRPLSATEMAALYRPVTATLAIPRREKTIQASARLPEGPALWDDKHPLPKAADLPVLEDVRFSVIKPYEFAKDGYRFLHGVAMCFHEGRLYASFGHNRGGENTDTEEARFCVSEDDGRTWSAVRTMDVGEGPVGVSHGSFLSHAGKLWAFQGAYTGIMQGIHTRAYTLDETSGQWQPRGTVIEGGFWPMQEPIRMDDGNWIMAGISAGVDAEKGTSPAAVAISRGEDFTKWDLVIIPPVPGIRMWGESTVFASGRRITNISRYGAEGRALVAHSEDYGRTWSEMRPSNLPMATSKPIAGTLSNGQHYLVCTTTADSGKRRAPLTIAVTKPGESVFSKVFVIRHAEFPGGPGESDKSASLSYPYAIEHDGKLYVGYSNSGNKTNRVGEGRQLWNNNGAELAVIPIEKLK